MFRYGNKVRSEASRRMLAGERVEEVAGVTPPASSFCTGSRDRTLPRPPKGPLTESILTSRLGDTLAATPPAERNFLESLHLRGHTPTGFPPTPPYCRHTSSMCHSSCAGEGRSA